MSIQSMSGIENTEKLPGRLYEAACFVYKNHSDNLPDELKEYITTDCDGMRTIKSSTENDDETLVEDKFFFPQGWFDFLTDSNSLPWHEHVVSKHGMIIDEHRAQLKD